MKQLMEVKYKNILVNKKRFLLEDALTKLHPHLSPGVKAAGTLSIVLGAGYLMHRTLHTRGKRGLYRLLMEFALPAFGVIKPLLNKKKEYPYGVN